MNIEKLINDLIEEKVAERLVEEKGKLKQTYEDLQALRASTLPFIYKLQKDIMFIYKFEYNLRALNYHYDQLQEIKSSFSSLLESYEEGMKNLYGTRKRLKHFFDDEQTQETL